MTINTKGIIAKVLLILELSSFVIGIDQTCNKDFYYRTQGVLVEVATTIFLNVFPSEFFYWLQMWKFFYERKRIILLTIT